MKRDRAIRNWRSIINYKASPANVKQVMISAERKTVDKKQEFFAGFLPYKPVYSKTLEA